MSEFCTIYVTCSDKEEAKNICKSLLSEKLIACGNIIDGATSIYEWQGELCEDNEALLFIKTKSDKSEMVVQKIKALHSYDVPCVVKWDITGGNDEYLDWINGQLFASLS